jgi:membrane protease subunit (stomatin/prohibitin family)
LTGVDVEEKLHGQEMHNGVGNAHTAKNYAEKVENAGKDHGAVWRHGSGIDYRGNGVGGVMKSVDKLECEDEKKSQEKAKAQPDTWYAKRFEHNRGLFRCCDKKEENVSARTRSNMLNELPSHDVPLIAGVWG